MEDEHESALNVPCSPSLLDVCAFPDMLESKEPALLSDDQSTASEGKEVVEPPKKKVAKPKKAKAPAAPKEPKAKKEPKPKQTTPRRKPVVGKTPPAPKKQKVTADLEDVVRLVSDAQKHIVETQVNDKFASLQKDFEALAAKHQTVHQHNDQLSRELQAIRRDVQERSQRVLSDKVRF